MRTGRKILAAACLLLTLAACDLSAARRPVFTAPAGEALTARAGDTVMDVRVTRPTWSAVGLLDVAGTRETARVLVRFTGMQDGKAVFQRHDLVMSRSEEPPLWIPAALPAPVADYAAAAQPITLALAPGEFMPLEGRRLTVRQVGPDTLDYTVE